MEAVPANSLSLAQLITAVLLFGGLLSAVLCVQHHRKHPPNHFNLTETMVNRSWTTPQVGILLAALFLLYLLASCSGLLFYEEQIPLARLIITIFIYAVLLVIIALINRRRGGSWTESLGMGWKNLRKMVLSPVLYLAFIPFLMLISKGYHVLLELLSHSEVELQDVAQMVSGKFTWLELGYILLAVFGAPVYEELIFRGVVFPYCVKRTGLKVAVLVVSLLFGLIHFHLPSFVPLALLSAALCLAYWRTGSLWVSIGIHMIFNAVSILVLNVTG